MSQFKQNIYFIDFETRSTANLKITGSYVYAEHPSTDILCLAYAFNDGPVKLWTPNLPIPADLMLHVTVGGKIVGHNVGGFEFLIWNNVGIKKYKFPPLTVSQIECTMAMSYAMALPGKLENAAAATGISHQKDMSGHRLMLQVSKPRDIEPDGKVIWWEDPNKFKKLYDYCMKDVEVERELYKRLLKLSDYERKVWVLDQKINSRGISVSLSAVELAQKLIEMEAKFLSQRMRVVTKNQVASGTAVAQLLRWIQSRGVLVEGVAKTDVLELLERKDLPKDVREALIIRQESSKSSNAKLDSIIGRVNGDGRIRGLFQYHGASTGRFAGRGVQLHNLPRPKNLKQKQIDEVFNILERG